MSGLSRRLQQVAERMAADSFEEHVAELVRLAAEDLDAVHEAIQEVQSKAETARTPEHIAFTLLAAAWRRIARSEPRESGQGPAGRGATGPGLVGGDLEPDRRPARLVLVAPGEGQAVEQ